MKNQRGIALIVALVVLSACTILGMATLRNAGTQQSILKNTQLLNIAKNISNSEINAQLENISQSNQDMEIQLTLDAGVGAVFDVANSDLEEVGLKSAQQSMSQAFTMELEGVDDFGPDGYSEGDSKINTLRIQMVSVSQLPDTVTESTQIQGIYYIVPKAGD